MPYGTPVTSNQIVYRADFENVTGPVAAASVTLKMVQGGEGGFTEAEQDALFQGILDALVESELLRLANDASKHQDVDTVVTPTETE